VESNLEYSIQEDGPEEPDTLGALATAGCIVDSPKPNGGFGYEEDEKD
jgi:hypothetical protein